MINTLRFSSTNMDNFKSFREHLKNEVRSEMELLLNQKTDEIKAEIERLRNEVIKLQQQLEEIHKNKLIFVME